MAHKSSVPPSYLEGRGQRLNRIIGRNVRAARKEQALTMTILSRISGIGRPLLTSIEHGTADIRLSYVQRLADALDVEAVSLLQEPEAPGKSAEGTLGP